MSLGDIKRAVITAVVIAAVSFVFTGGLTFFGLTGWAAFAALTATLAALNFVGRKLTPTPDGGEQGRVRGTVRAAAEEPRYIYGRARVGGHAVFYEEWNTGSGSNRASRFIIVLGEGELDGAQRFWVNNVQMPVKGNLDARGKRTFGLNELIQPNRQVWESWVRDAENTFNDCQYTDTDGGTRYVQFLRDDHDKLSERLNAVKWFADGAGEPIIGMMMVYGGEPPTSGAEPEEHAYNASGHFLAGPSDSKWTRFHRLYGKTYLVVKCIQYGSRGQWQENGGAQIGIQNVNALVRGLKLKHPSGLVQWTENAAAARYHFHTKILNIPQSEIDQQSFSDAFNVCEQRIEIPPITASSDRGQRLFDSTFPDRDDAEQATIDGKAALVQAWNDRYAGSGEFRNEQKSELRYSCNGVITGSEVKRNADTVMSHLDACWSGYVVRVGTRLQFRPGAPRTPVMALDESHIVNAQPSVALDSPIGDNGKATSMDAELISSAHHSWAPFRLQRITDHVAVERGDGADFVRDLGQLRFVAYPHTAQRLITFMLRQESENRIVTANLWLFHDAESGTAPIADLVPSDRVMLNLPSIGVNGGTWRLNSMSHDSTDGVFTGTFIEEPNNLYTDSFNQPIGFVQGGLEYTVPPRAVDFAPTDYLTHPAGFEQPIMPITINGRTVQYRVQAVSDTANWNWLGFENAATIAPFNPQGIVSGPGNVVNGTYRISARYVSRRGDTVVPLSLWSHEVWGDVVYWDSTMWLAGGFRSQNNRLPRLAFIAGVHRRSPYSSGARLTSSNPNTGFITFGSASEIGLPTSTAFNLFGYLSPIINQPSGNFSFGDLLTLTGEPRSPNYTKRWQVSVGTAPSGDDAPLYIN